jgi:hypothetical protein
MTKNEAIVKMLNGNKMTHACFQPDEYFKMNPLTLDVTDEDDHNVTYIGFVNLFSESKFLKGWREWHPVDEEPEYPEYTDQPVLDPPSDVYYSGYGPTWGIDMHGRRHWKLYDPIRTRGSEYRHLNKGDIINERARIEKIVTETILKLKKEGKL